MFSVLCRLGADTVVRTTPNGQSVASLSLAYSVGFGEKKQTQWLDGQLWGERALKLAPFLTKGKQLLVHADDVIAEVYERRDKNIGCTLKARIVNIEFTDDRPSGSSTTPAETSSPPLDTDWRDITPPF